MKRLAFTFALSLLVFCVSCRSDKIEITVLESADGLVRISGWEEPHSGTMGCYGTLIEYKWNGRNYKQDKAIDGTDEPLMPMKLYSLDKGKYILYSYLREWSSQAYIEARALKLSAEGLTPIDLFETEDGLKDRIYTEYNIPDWYFRAGDGDGYEWLYHYDKAKMTLYHPSSPEINTLSDRYIPYIWNGKTLSPSKEVANPFLHPSLGKYECLVSLFRTKRNLVRIDYMPDDSFRYAAWANTNKMSDKPEIVISGGFFDEDHTEWIFTNAGYEYHCSPSDLYIMKDHREIARWEKQ